MADRKVDIVVMEVSSQSLKLDRVTEIQFASAIFTNLGEDHISPNEHPSLEDYYNCKKKLFTMCKEGFVNIDDKKGEELIDTVKDCNYTTYGIDNNSAQVLAKDIVSDMNGVSFKVQKEGTEFSVKCDIPGKYTVYNCLAAISASLKYGVSENEIINALKEIKISGRAELIPNKYGYSIMLDYAHNPQSLKNILESCKSYVKGRLISVTGCGGDRDKSKRPIMGKILGEIADYSIITSDNPRNENPETIVSEIEEGIKQTNGKYEVIVKREDAIYKAIQIMNKDDIVVLTGKGNEKYQEINGKQYTFDEREIALKALKIKEENK